MEDSEISFNDGFGNWIMRLKNGRIYFNKENWSNSEPDEFALAVIALLEKAVVKMDKWDNRNIENSNENE